MILFDLVWFYGISTIVGYLIPNPVYKYIRYMWFVNKLTKLNSSKYCNASRKVQLNTSHLFTHLLNAQAVQFLSIQFSASQQS